MNLEHLSVPKPFDPFKRVAASVEGLACTCDPRRRMASVLAEVDDKLCPTHERAEIAARELEQKRQVEAARVAEYRNVYAELYDETHPRDEPEPVLSFGAADLAATIARGDAQTPLGGAAISDGQLHALAAALDADTQL